MSLFIYVFLMTNMPEGMWRLFGSGVCLGDWWWRWRRATGSELWDYTIRDIDGVHFIIIIIDIVISFKDKDKDKEKDIAMHCELQSDLVTKWLSWLFLTNWETLIMSLRASDWQHRQFLQCLEIPCFFYFVRDTDGVGVPFRLREQRASNKFNFRTPTSHLRLRNIITPPWVHVMFFSPYL